MGRGGIINTMKKSMPELADLTSQLAIRESHLDNLMRSPMSEVFKDISSLKISMPEYAYAERFRDAFLHLERESGSMAGLLKVSREFQVTVENFAKPWREMEGSIAAVADHARWLNESLSMHSLAIRERATFAEKVVADVVRVGFDPKFGLGSAERMGVLDNSVGLTHALGNVFRDYSAELIASLPPGLTSAPSNNVLLDARLLQTFALEPELEPDAALTTDVTTDTSEILGRIDPRLPQLLAGARLANTSTNPDRVRHVCASLREMYTHCFHTLAPDDDVVAWSTDPRDFKDGSPTREARFRYMCRNLPRASSLLSFMKCDAKAAIEFYQLLNGGLHGLESSIGPAHLEALIIRMEGLVKFIALMAETR